MIRKLPLFCLTWLLAFSARAELTIEITQGVASAIPISVVPFQNASGGAVSQDLDDIIRNDLGRSGHFTTLAPNDMLSLPASEREVYFRDWRLLKQDYVLIGQIMKTPDNQRYQVRYQLFDVAHEKQLLTQVLSGTDEQLRDIAHKVSDAVYERLTGIRGVFSTKIAYVTTNSNRTQFNLTIADADGARERVIFKSKNSIFSPAWAPDGRRIAYASLENERSEVFIQDIFSGSREKIASFKGLNSSPAFSPDGNRLSMTLSKDGNPEIYILNLQTRQWQRVTNHYAIDTEASWLADGQNIIFTSNRSGKPQIYKANVNSGAVERITFEGGYNARARVAQEGRFIVLVHQDDKSGAFHIASLDLRRGLLRELSSDTQLDESPSVSPNGVMVLYAAKQKGRSILAAVSVDGDVKFLLPSKLGDVREPAWGPYPN